MQVRLYLDEDASSRSVTRGLRVRGIDVLTAIDAGRLGRDDAEQLEFAVQQERVLYTYNVSHFYQLHSDWLTQGRSHSGIILVAQTFGIGEQLRRTFKLVANRSAEAMVNHMEFLSAWS